jgi:hypothetical protein
MIIMIMINIILKHVNVGQAGLRIRPAPAPGIPSFPHHFISTIMVSTSSHPSIPYPAYTVPLPALRATTSLSLDPNCLPTPSTKTPLTLLSNIETPRAIWVLVPAPEELAEDGVVRLLYTFGLDVPAGEVVLEDSEEAFFGVFDLLRTGDPRGE